MNLVKELQKLPMDSLEKALSKMTNNELIGLANPIADTPRSLRGENTSQMLLMITDELEHRNPALWLAVSADLERREARAARMDTFLAPFRK